MITKLKKILCVSVATIFCILCASACKHKDEAQVVEQDIDKTILPASKNARLKNLSIGYIKDSNNVEMNLVKGFSSNSNAPISVESAESVNVKFKMIPEVEGVSSITLQNKTVSNDSMRASKTGAGGYISPRAVSLANGINDIEIKVTSKDKTETKVYKLKIKYEEPKHKIPTDVIFDGFKCPDAALDEYVWIIFGNGG